MAPGLGAAETEPLVQGPVYRKAVFGEEMGYTYDENAKVTNQAKRVAGVSEGSPSSIVPGDSLRNEQGVGITVFVESPVWYQLTSRWTPEGRAIGRLSRSDSAPFLRNEGTSQSGFLQFVGVNMFEHVQAVGRSWLCMPKSRFEHVPGVAFRVMGL